MIKNVIVGFLYFVIELIEKLEYFYLNLDEDDSDKKILDTMDGLNIDVLSDSGLVRASSIHITQPYRVYRIDLSNGYYIECADNHILFRGDYKEVFVNNLLIGDCIFTDVGKVEIIGIKRLGRKLSMFDLSIDSDDHRYYTNDILSHNTINSSITILHFITFNNDKNAMIVANVAATTVEIIDKIKNIYSLLPFFLKVGIKNWNQKSIICGNGCRIKSAARSKTPAIGFTIDLLYMDEFAHIPSTIIEPYYTAVFPTVSAIENSKIIITSTPNGMNLFYRLLMDGERPDGDPQKNNYKAMRVYWYQVPGRFTTYLRLNEHKMLSLGISKDSVYSSVKDLYGDKTKVELKFNSDNMRYSINLQNNDLCTEEQIREFVYIDDNEMEHSINSFSEVTTWKNEAIKDIGGEDAFNQEYGLRFINATRSLLNESTIESLLNGKINYEWRELYEFDNRLKFSYSDLKWVEDYDKFSPINRKNISGVMSIDISEGLGQDYSVINIFQIVKKPDVVIELNKVSYTHISDFFCLEQIAIYRCNYTSVKQLAEIFYVLAFEYFNPDNFKVVLEINTYGNEFLAHLPNIFDGNNDYGSSIFFRYKHRSDSLEEKIGIKINENKNMLVKEYQTAMFKKNIVVNNEDNIREITTFVKHTTSSGNIRYACDMGSDDTVMTLVDMSSVFEKYSYREMVEDYAKRTCDPNLLLTFNDYLNNNVEYVESADYSALLNVNRKRKMLKQYKSINSNWLDNNNR